MNVRNIATIGGVLIALAAASYLTVRGQGPLYDQVTVDLPYVVNVRGTVLQPGHYVIRQMSSADISNRVLQIYSNDGMKLETTVMTIPALDNTPPNDSQLVLRRLGNDYYFDKIWIQGKNYGYEFVLPENVRMREQERQAAVNVPASYQASPAPQAGLENQPPASQQPDNSPVAATPPAVTPDAQASTAEPAPPSSAPAPSPSSSDAQAAPQPSEPTAAAPSQAPAVSADHTKGGESKMPDTAANWVSWLLSGSALSGAGMLLRRRAR